MMNTRISQHTVWIILMLLSFSGAILIKGCRKDRHPGSPAATSQSQRPAVNLKLRQGDMAGAKAIGILVEALPIKDDGTTGDAITPVSVDSPITFPLDIPVAFYVPPCDHQITITVTLSRDAPVIKQFALDVCQAPDVIELFVDTFEEMLLPSGADPLHVPKSAKAGETITASCGPLNISVPDGDIAAVESTLFEEDGVRIHGPISIDEAVSDQFQDPYPMETSPQTTRMFTCVITDDNSPAKTFTKTVERILPEVQADANGPYMVNCDANITLDGSNSFAEVGIASIRWEFGGNPTILSGADTLEPQIQYQCPTNQNYTVTLTITDHVGTQSTATTEIQTELPDVQADANGPYTVDCCANITLDGSNSFAEVGIASISWEFDGNPTILSGENTLEPQIQYQCSTSQNYTATLTITDHMGTQSTATTEIRTEAIPYSPYCP